ncbi:O-antigen ligase family protein [Flagellimonas myxillae]|uniref:O-antigen ligase family protein n=1 Tax=Flagellimonas myxillae TaxID=2942214 RepID=UPI00201F0547|nr:O-antigen ligase family protein [Muricauda myxillae]MCL6266672.1 O-antigen ligase family protein [Muricauda myxillae]
MNIDSIISRTTNVLLLLFISFTVLPVKLNYSSITIVALLVVALVNLILKENKGGVNGYVFVLSVPLLVYVAGMINTENLDNGWSFVTRNLSFLAFPIIFYSLGNRVQKQKIFNAYLVILTLVNIYLLYLFAYYFNFGERFYKIVTVDIYHSTYLGLYNLFGYWICIAFVHKGNSRRYFFWALFLLISAMATSARIIFVLSIASLIFTAPLFFKSILGRLGLVLGTAIFAFVVFNYAPSIKQKFSQISELEHFGFDKDNHRGVSSRFGNIDASFQLIQKNTMWGTGTGDITDELVEVYKKMGFTMGYKYRYNPHNQYLDNLVRNGIIGGGIGLLFIYLIPLWVSFRKKDLLLTTFILLVAGVSFTESLLDVHKGITFYAFFVCLLYTRHAMGGELKISKMGNNKNF